MPQNQSISESIAKPAEPPAEGRILAHQIRAFAVHAYTACGAVLAFLATVEICSERPDPRIIFLLLLVAVIVDATDGTFARRWEVKRWAATIDGRTIDDLVDYLTYTFVPLLLIWRMDWLPHPAVIWTIPPLVTSLFGFAHCGAKNESAGFFRGFPSYWNIVAFYAGLWPATIRPWANAALLLILAILTVLPVRFLYPTLAPSRWRRALLAGSVVWILTLIAILPDYPNPPGWLVVLSLVYPIFYTVLSWHLSSSTKQ